MSNFGAPHRPFNMYDDYEQIRRDDEALVKETRFKKNDNWDGDLGQTLAGRIDTRDVGSRAIHTHPDDDISEAAAHKLRNFLQDHTSPFNLSRRAVPFYDAENTAQAPHAAKEAHTRLTHSARHLLSDVDQETLVSFVDEIIDICKANNKSDHEKLDEIRSLLPDGYKGDASHDALVELMTLAEGYSKLVDVVEDERPQLPCEQVLDENGREIPPENLLADKAEAKAFGRTAYIKPSRKQLKQSGILLMGDVEDEYDPDLDDELGLPGGEPEYMDVEVAVEE